MNEDFLLGFGTYILGVSLGMGMLLGVMNWDDERFFWPFVIVFSWPISLPALLPLTIAYVITRKVVSKGKGI